MRSRPPSHTPSRLAAAFVAALGLGFSTAPAQAEPSHRSTALSALILAQPARGTSRLGTREQASAAETYQHGQGHSAHVQQSGGSNRVLIRQHGSNHAANVSQTGGNNSLAIIQLGSGAIANVTQSGNQKSVILQWSK